MDYIGERCPVCNEIFSSADDVVVCPECGTPHHRACYAAENKCANSDYHSMGKLWERTVPEKKQVKVCPVCRFENSENDSNCQRCGTQLTDVSNGYNDNKRSGSFEDWRDPISMREEMTDPVKFLGMDPDEDVNGATIQEVSDFVGVNSIYYLPKFKRMKDEGIKPTFNFSSMIFPSLYFANRKMWGWAILAAFLGIIFNLPADILLYMEELPAEIAGLVSENERNLKTLNDVFLFADIGVRALFGLFANWFYFRFALRTIKKHRKNGSPASAIKSKGGIKPLNMVFITLIKSGLGFVILSSLYFFVHMFSTIKDFSSL